jgi:hypothetical protein
MVQLSRQLMPVVPFEGTAVLLEGTTVDTWWQRIGGLGRESHKPL